MIAIIPTVIVMKISGDRSVDTLLVLSQVILSLQLPFALVPLLHFTSSKFKMKEFASIFWIRAIAWIAAGFIIVLNLKLVYDFIAENISASGAAGDLTKFLLIPIVTFLIGILGWIIFEPYLKKEQLVKLEKMLTKKPIASRAAKTMDIQKSTYKKVGIALEGNTQRDEKIIDGSLPLLKTLAVNIYLIHCVETVAGRFIGDLVGDEKANEMHDYLLSFVNKLKKENISAMPVIGGGEPEDEIARICKVENLELLIVGSHGHKLLGDIIHGSTANEVRHRVKIPVLAIPVEE